MEGLGLGGGLVHTAQCEGVKILINVADCRSPLTLIELSLAFLVAQ